MVANKMPGARTAPVYDAAFGPRLGQHFGLSAVPFLATPEDAPHFAVTRICAAGGLRPMRWIPAEPAYLAILPLIPARFQIRRAGKDVECYEGRVGCVELETLDDALLLSFRGPFDCLIFYIQCRFLEKEARALGMTGFGTLRCCHGTQDGVLWSIGKALLPLITAPEQASVAFMNHLARAVCLHLVHTYGGFR